MEKLKDIFLHLGIEAGHYAAKCFEKLDSARICKAGQQGTEAAKQQQQQQQRSEDRAQLGVDTQEHYLSGAYGHG